MMRAVRVEKFGGPKVMTVQEIPIPSADKTKVLVKIFSAGVNPVDTYIREGAFSGLPSLPYTPGKDGAGIVEAVGENVTMFKKGDRVFVCMIASVGHGTYGQYALAEEKHVFPLHESLSYDQGAALGIPYFTAFRALFIKGRAVAGETLLVHGASGAVGLASIQIAKAHGMQVIGTAGTSEGMDIVKQNGADHVVCHREKHYLKKVMEITNDRGVDIIIEMLANVNLGSDLEILATHGRVLVVGSRGTVKIDPGSMMGPETEIMGVALLNSSDEEWQKISAGVLDGIAKGWIKPVIDRKYSLEESSNAHHDIIHSKGAKGKLIISVSNE